MPKGGVKAAKAHNAAVRAAAAPPASPAADVGTDTRASAWPGPRLVAGMWGACVGLLVGAGVTDVLAYWTSL